MKYPIILAMGFLGILKGVGLLIGHAAVNTTGLAMYFKITHDNYLLVACFMCLIGLLTLSTLFVKNVFKITLLLIPQLFVWLYYSVSAVWSMYIGVYANGYAPPVNPHLFIYEDQIYVPAFFICYVYTVINLIKKR